MMRRLALASALFVAVGSAAPSMAVAGSATSNLDISASVPANCTISTAAVTFGNYDPILTNKTQALTGSGTVIATCTASTGATIKLGQGSNPSSTSSDGNPIRSLAFNGYKLGYYLYQDSNRTTIWGNTAGTGLAYTGNGSSANLSVYGKIPEDQQVPAGSYTDIVLATILY